MNKSARSVLRRLGQDQSLENEREELVSRELEEASSRQRGDDQQEDSNTFENVPQDMLTEIGEKARAIPPPPAAMAGRVTPAAERLPIMTSEQREARDKNRPKWRATEFEGL